MTEYLAAAATTVDAVTMLDTDLVIVIELLFRRVDRIEVQGGDR